MTHKSVSLFKSLIRMLGYVLLGSAGGYLLKFAAMALIVAEILGILEELVDRRLEEDPDEGLPLTVRTYVADLISAGKRIQAIQAIRAVIPGLSFRDSKALMERIEHPALTGVAPIDGAVYTGH